MTKNEIIKKLSMTKHIEGGYFSQTYRSEFTVDTDRLNNHRPLLTSIYYMLTDDRPIGYFHKNKSDIVHYFHCGHALTYLIIHPNGEFETVKLGSNIEKNEFPQLIVKGGCWKATILEEGSYGLLGESVAPGFDYHDMELATPENLKSLFPYLWPKISNYTRSE